MLVAVTRIGLLCVMVLNLPAPNWGEQPGGPVLMESGKCTACSSLQGAVWGVGFRWVQHSNLVRNSGVNSDLSDLFLRDYSMFSPFFSWILLGGGGLSTCTNSLSKLVRLCDGKQGCTWLGLGRYHPEMWVTCCVWEFLLELAICAQPNQPLAMNPIAKYRLGRTMKSMN